MSELPRGWELVAFPDFVFFQEGPGLRKYQYRETGIPFLNIRTFDDETINKTLCGFLDPKEVEEKYQHFLVDEGDILVAISGSIGKMAIARLGDLPLMLNTSIMRFRSLYEDALLRRYIYFFLKSEHFFKQAEKAWTGTAQKNMGPSHIKTFKLLLPPLNEQRRIVAKLDRLFARSRRAREELGRVSGLVQRYKQAILAAAFRGDLTADWRKENADSLIANHFLIEAGIKPADEANLPSLPNGWCWVLAGNLCSIKSGVALGKKRSPGTGLLELPYLRVANVQRGWLDLNEIKTVLVTPKEAEALYLKAGDVLMNEGGDRDKLGRGWVWDGQIDNCIHQNHVFRLRLKTDKVSPHYISYFANEFGQKYFMDQGKQTTNLASISMSKLSKFPLPIAPPEEMKLILQLTEKLFENIDLMEQEHQQASKLLDRLEQATLSKAFRGELVPQDPNDEPAAVLLERIQSDRQAQPKGKAIKSKQSHR